jgi:hypothetical protein
MAHASKRRVETLSIAGIYGQLPRTQDGIFTTTITASLLANRES